MGPHARPPRRAARDRARPQRARAPCAASPGSPASAPACPTVPRYAEAFQAIGPAAIKLGQTLATRPDLIGEEAAHDLMRLQDALPPVPFATIRAAIEASLGRPIDDAVRQLRRHARRRRLDRAGPPRGHDRGRARSRSRCCAPASRRNSPAPSTPIAGPPRSSRRWAARPRRLRPRLVIETFARWTARELDLRREGASASELAEAMQAEPAYFVPAIDWDRTTGRVLTLEWIDGIKLTDSAALLAAGNDPKRSPNARPRLPAPGDLRRLLPRRHASGKPVRAARRPHRRDRFRHHGPDRPPRAGLARRNPLRPDHRQL